jgi:UDP-3-O-[3-hydroxymyristoyl] glucosamine N-acyltransferase
LTLSELAARLGCRLEGDGGIEIARVATLDAAGPGDVTFYANPRYRKQLAHTRASAVILDEDAPAVECAMLRTPAPYVAFANAIAALHPIPRPAPGISPHAAIAPDASIAAGVTIGPFVAIGSRARVGARTILHSHVAIGDDAEIGEDCVVHSHVAVREGVRIGARVVLQNGVVVGADGFGFATGADGVHQKIPQIGTVVVEDDVEIGANTTIDRPPLGATTIGAGTKIDNLVQIAHGVSIGRGVLLAAQVGIAGSSTVEDGVVLAGQVGVAGHVTLGHGMKATAQTGIPNSVKPGAFVSGYPAIDNREWLKASAIFRALPELRRTVVDLGRRLEQLERHTTATSDSDAAP